MARAPAVAGFLDVDDAGKASARTYPLPAAHAEVLLDSESLAHMPLDLAVASLASALPLVVDGCRSGAGVSYEAYGEDIRSFIARLTGRCSGPARPGVVPEDPRPG